MSCPPDKIRVLLVDDSKAVRTALQFVLADEPDIEVIGAAADPFEAVECMRKCTPDVIILDLEMPRMDGLTFLGKIMKQHPIPVIVCSALVGGSSGEAVLALERGAVDVIAKPKVGAMDFLGRSRELIVDSVRAAAAADIARRPLAKLPEMRPGIAGGVAAAEHRKAASATGKVVVIGASTGGTEALHLILQDLPSDCAGVVIAQHMPPHFTTAFAKRLDDLSALHVVEAQGGERVEPGCAFVAPGDRHVCLEADGLGARINVADSPPVNRHRPSVDVLFRSAAGVAGRNALGVLLTGMGADGAAGLLEMRHSGARTIAQDEATSVVWGMPAAAVQTGAAERVLPVGDIADAIAHWSRA